jgi:hypothetical protein
MMEMNAMQEMAEAHRRQLLDSARSLRAGATKSPADLSERAVRQRHRPAPRQRVGSWLIQAGTRLGGASIRTS